MFETVTRWTTAAARRATLVGQLSALCSVSTLALDSMIGRAERGASYAALAVADGQERECGPEDAATGRRIASLRRYHGVGQYAGLALAVAFAPLILLRPEEPPEEGGEP